jgi:hypothetical protein
MNILDEYHQSKHSKISGEIGMFTGYGIWLLVYIFGKLSYKGIMFIVKKINKRK